MTYGMARRCSRGVRIWVAAMTLLGGLLCQAPAAHAQFVKSIEQDHGTYYRLKVKLTYWGTPQDFDIVVGCNVRQINYRDGSNTYEAGLVPTVFGRRMYDGKGLVIGPPNACRGETTANGKVQPDLLPLAIVYENADTLSFGIAYLSEDAYEGPLSVLSFGGATIEKATRAEFDEFRRTQTNLVKRELYYSSTNDDRMLKRLGLPRVPATWAFHCAGYQRFLIPEDVKPLVRQRWPESHPQYWLMDDWRDVNEVYFAIRKNKQVKSDRESDVARSPIASELASIGSPDRGMSTRAGGGLISAPLHVYFPGAYYPSTTDFRIDKWPDDRAGWARFVAQNGPPATTTLDFRNGQSRGFAYCSVHSKTELPKDLNGKPTGYAGPRVIARVDGQDVVSKQPPGRAPQSIFERDEYEYRLFQFGLATHGGDV